MTVTPLTQRIYTCNDIYISRKTRKGDDKMVVWIERKRSVTPEVVGTKIHDALSMYLEGECKACMVAAMMGDNVIIHALMSQIDCMLSDLEDGEGDKTEIIQDIRELNEVLSAVVEGARGEYTHWTYGDLCGDKEACPECNKILEPNEEKVYECPEHGTFKLE